jgi:predicted RNA binding protein YcfA (HicA-like mRNA interferase family)
MRLPRDLTGAQLVRALDKLGYVPTRQTGSHVRLTCQLPAQHHVTIPLHDPLRIGTLAKIFGGGRRGSWHDARCVAAANSGLAGATARPERHPQ